jgi:hypothetical protein
VLLLVSRGGKTFLTSFLILSKLLMFKGGKSSFKYSAVSILQYGKGVALERAAVPSLKMLLAHLEGSIQ